MASLLQKLGGLQLNAEHRFRRLTHRKSQEKADPFLDSRGEGKQFNCGIVLCACGDSLGNFEMSLSAYSIVCNEDLTELSVPQ